MFDTWNSMLTMLLPTNIPSAITAAMVAHEGWLWRRGEKNAWSQRFAVILNGVMYFFVDTTASDQFKLIVARGDEGVFVAAQFAEGSQHHHILMN